MMREKSGHSGRVSKGLKAALVALMAVFAIGMFSTASANAAQQLKLSFNDSWIGVDALGDSGTFHAIDPADPEAITVDLTGDLASDGSFTAPKAAFSFPEQHIDAGDPIGTITLQIEASSDITGNYNKSTGAFSAQLPLTLRVLAPGLMACQISPLNIPLATTGSKDFGTEEAPNVKQGSPFASGTGAVLGSWTDVGVEDVKDIDPDSHEVLDPQPGMCATLIGAILSGQGIDSFDGTIWLGGTTTVTGDDTCPEGKVGTPPNCKDPVCPEGQEGTPPNCHDIVTPKAVISKVTVTKATIKAGKKGKIKVTVKNTGDAAFSGKVTLKSNNKQVKVAKSVSIKVGAGKSATKTIVVKTTKKAKGKATITAKVSGKSGKGKVTIKKAKKKKKK
jgi:hypothetical protein